MVTASRLPEGTVVLDLACPACGAAVPIVATIDAVLTTATADPPRIRARVRAAPVPHFCGQEVLFEYGTVDTVDA